MNFDVNLDWYSHFVPCGLEGKQVTSIQGEVNRKLAGPEIAEVQHYFEPFLKCFAHNFLHTRIFPLHAEYPQLHSEIMNLVSDG